MKIAIKGDELRGKEVIQILESLGGINCNNLRGNALLKTYYIDERIIRYASTPKNYKVYTLEEFETQFPFKVGDIVQTKPYGEPAEVIGLYPNPACIIAYKVRYKSGIEMQYCPENIKFYKEMKEERNITLTFEKAKEWYNKGGELKEIALQAFSEEELTKVDLPKTWEEFCENYPIKGEVSYIDADSDIHVILPCVVFRDKVADRNMCPSKKSAEAHLALIQLEQLRDCWRQGWKPTEDDTGYCIVNYFTSYTVTSFNFRSFLSFPTKEIAEEFLKCFRYLIEKAEDLI